MVANFDLFHGSLFAIVSATQTTIMASWKFGLQENSDFAEGLWRGNSRFPERVNELGQLTFDNFERSAIHSRFPLRRENIPPPDFLCMISPQSKHREREYS
jgi:hypothetical protein